MRRVYNEDGVSEVVESMLILSIVVVMFVVVSGIIIHDYTSQNPPAKPAGFSVNFEKVYGAHAFLPYIGSVLTLNLTYKGASLSVANTTMILVIGTESYYVGLSDNDFSGSRQWYPGGPVKSGEYVVFNSSLSNTVGSHQYFNGSSVAVAFDEYGKLVWSNSVFYPVPVITALSYEPSHVLANLSMSFSLYIYSSYQITGNVVYVVSDASNGSVVDKGDVYPMNVTGSNEWYFPGSGKSPVSMPYQGEYYVTITIDYVLPAHVHVGNSVREASQSFSIFVAQ